ncbi:hypothetical protein GCM10010280_65780 [Streptomyces pilosus]|uniref:Uncharacterized protein n=1 Tax=Streptomyces pilosus TaxID=28893 RepID=A0A918C6A5_9ACTN|nr:hypothetical protein GCM10010280_65780 [Streptomyces pilosus]
MGGRGDGQGQDGEGGGCQAAHYDSEREHEPFITAPTGRYQAFLEQAARMDAMVVPARAAQPSHDASGSSTSPAPRLYEERVAAASP